MKYRTRKLRKQSGRGILKDGIKTKSKVGDKLLSYGKVCPEGFVMCDEDEVNSTLCVPNDRESLCSDPNYKFRYVPPDESDRDARNPANRWTKEKDGKGPIQDPDNPVKVFEIKYEDDEDYRQMFEDDVIMNEETGRYKSYAPEFHPTSCAIQQKSEATVEKAYENGQMYKKRIDGEEITLNLGERVVANSPFSIVTQNALGLYRGKYRQQPEPGSAPEATYDIMKLRTALFRKFLKDRQPDFVCLQESTRTFIDLLDKDEVSTIYPYMYPTEDEMVTLENNGSNATVTLLSKYPVKKSTTYMLQGNSSYYNALGIYEFDNLIIFNVYMQAGSEISPGLKYKWDNFARCRRQQLIFVKQKIEEIKSACDCDKGIVVLGDFNFELNSIHYRTNNGRHERDSNNHLIYDPSASDMKWSEHKFLVGPNGLNLNDSYKELHIDDPDKVMSEGLTENTEINTLRYLGKLEEKALRYDGVFFNDDLVPVESEVVNNVPTKLNASSASFFESHGIPEYTNNIEKYNEEYEKYMVFNPQGNQEATRKKDAFRLKRPDVNKSDGFELFVSDHFGVMTTFEIKNQSGGKRRRKRVTRRRYKKGKRRASRRR